MDMIDSDAAERWIQQLGKETNKHVLNSMLTNISKAALPPEMDISLIIACTKSEHWVVRHSAILALGASPSNAARLSLREWLSQEDDKKYKYEIIYANAAMSRIGLLEDISFIEKHLKSRLRDVRGSAQWAIETIQKRQKRNK